MSAHRQQVKCIGPTHSVCANLCVYMFMLPKAKFFEAKLKIGKINRMVTLSSEWQTTAEHKYELCV